MNFDVQKASLMSRAAPRLRDITFSYFCLHDCMYLDPFEFTAVVRIAQFCAARTAWTYSPPGDACAPADVSRLGRITGLDAKELERCQTAIESFFELRDGHYWPRREWFQVASGFKRPPIPASLRSHVLRRDEFTCCYCGSKAGPFEIDHVVPISAGGHPIDPDNLMTACKDCNRSKRAMALEQWMTVNG